MVMHGGVHPREVLAPHGMGPGRLAWNRVRKQQLLDHDIIWLPGCMPPPPDTTRLERSGMLVWPVVAR